MLYIATVQVGGVEAVGVVILCTYISCFQVHELVFVGACTVVMIVGGMI